MVTAIYSINNGYWKIGQWSGTGVDAVGGGGQNARTPFLDSASLYSIASEGLQGMTKRIISKMVHFLSGCVKEGIQGRVVNIETTTGCIGAPV